MVPFGHRRLVMVLGIAASVLLTDALASWLVHRSFAPSDRHVLVPGLLVLTSVRNTGAAFGLFAGQRWLLVLIASAIVVLVPLLMRSLPTGRWPWVGPIVTGMLIGGALGNLLERAWLGYVIDFLHLPAVPLFQVFNLSDAAISLAVVLLLVLALAAGTPPSAPPTPEPRPSHEREAV